MTVHNDENEGHDARLRALLRGAYPEPPLDEVDWTALRRRIASDAAPRLARMVRTGRARNVWWEYAARWAAPALPAALAAAAALVLVLGRLVGTVATPVSTGVASESTGTTARVALEAALGASGRDTESRVMFASADEDTLLRMAVTGQ